LIIIFASVQGNNISTVPCSSQVFNAFLIKIAPHYRVRNLRFVFTLGWVSPFGKLKIRRGQGAVMDPKGRKFAGANVKRSDHVDFDRDWKSTAGGNRPILCGYQIADPALLSSTVNTGTQSGDFCKPTI
jgi:hypothetical protein